ncbi:substrate-binding periplasmic protein [Colwellia psychrerythraea]|uniref:ABC-type transporter, periplasmic subunit family 3 n=1 Tax=Colwellia psychrerythraea TaxID=28229 RepID=A0A099KWZ2_COLPS|nr:transporter substrate-binding domain-containing protein [Colwellia psychrerythraea]KGJ95096.1 ABC-type transporter, periplasmic subunit family 3 [Colwellia psychrerythraea]
MGYIVKFLPISLLLVTSFYCFGYETTKKEVLCVPESPPYSGKNIINKGPLSEVIVNALNLTGINVQVMIAPWARIMHEAENDRCMIGGLWPTKRRKALFHFSTKPAIKQMLGLYIRSDKTLKEVQGGILAMQRSSYLPAVLMQQNWMLHELTHPSQGLGMLALSRVDALFAETGHMNYLIAQDDILTKEIKLAIPELQAVNGYLAVSKKNPNAKEIIDTFDKNVEKVLKRMRHSENM